MKIEQEDGGEPFGDSDFLAMRDLAVQDFRASEKDSKHKIIEKMLALRHNMKYNRHLLSVYMKAKGLFDTMVEEHRSQLHSLDEIYRHLNHLIRENLSKQRIKSKKNGGSSEMMAELVKDKNRIATLLKKMRNSYEKLMNVDTVIGVTVDKINEITFMGDDDNNVKKNDSDEEDSEVNSGAEDEEDDSEVTNGAEDDEDDNDSEVTNEAEEEDEDEEDSEVTNEAEDDDEEENDEEDDDEEDDDDDEEENDEEEEEEEEEEDEEDEEDDDSEEEEEEEEDEDDEEVINGSDRAKNKNDIIYIF